MSDDGVTAYLCVLALVLVIAAFFERIERGRW